MLLAIAITTFGFAQRAQLDASKIVKPVNPQNLENGVKSAWIGGGFDSYYTGANTGDEFFIVGSAFAESVEGDEITKVKFYHELGTVSFSTGDVTFDNTEYTIRIYENPTLGGSYAAYGLFDVPIGTPVYSESVTLSAAESSTIYEHTLTTPYTINSNDFWVSISFDNGKGAMRLAGPAASNENVYYMYYNYESVNYVVTTDFGDGTTSAFMAIGLALYVDDGGTYVEQSDLGTKFLNTYPDPTNYISELTISETEDLVVYPIVVNNGPDATSADATYSATINGEELIAATQLDLTTTPLENTYSNPIIMPDVAYTITAAELDALTLPLTFDVCFTTTYSGNDPVADNNTACITVTRGELPETNCDLEAIFMTSNTDATPIASEVTLSSTEDITLFPGIANNGPDDANTNAAVTITIDGTSVIDQTIDITGLTNGGISALTNEGYEITAATMDAAGLSGTFDVCLTVTYESNDGDATNNTSCVSITRETVNVEENISKNISVFPNPANNVITVMNAENKNIVVMNMLGEVVANINNATANQRIDISKLAEGTYFVKIDSEMVKITVVK